MKSSPMKVKLLIILETNYYEKIKAKLDAMIFNPGSQIFSCFLVIFAVILNVVSIAIIGQNIGVLFLGIFNDVGVIIGSTWNSTCKASFFKIQQYFDVIWQVFYGVFSFGLLLNFKRVIYEKETNKIQLIPFSLRLFLC